MLKRGRLLTSPCLPLLQQQKNFKYQKSPLNPQQVFENEQKQRKLSQQEELFLHYLSAEEAAVASHSLQLEWRAQFLGLAKRSGQTISNLCEWQDILRERTSSGSSQDGGQGSEKGDDDVASDNGSLTGGGAEEKRGMKGLAPLMVRMAADRRRNFTVQHGVIGATSYEDLLRSLKTGQETECCILARASNGAILFASAGLQRMLARDDSDLLGNVLLDPTSGKSC